MHFEDAFIPRNLLEENKIFVTEWTIEIQRRKRPIKNAVSRCAVLINSSKKRDHLTSATGDPECSGCDEHTALAIKIC